MIKNFKERKLNRFIEERLISGKAGCFDPIKTITREELNQKKVKK